MQAFWHFMAIYGILAFLPKSLIGNQIRFLLFYLIFRLFPTFRLADSTALAPVLKVYPHAAHVRGTKASWGDQKAGGPENLLALRAEGTRVLS